MVCRPTRGRLAHGAGEASFGRQRVWAYRSTREKDSETAAGGRVPGPGPGRLGDSFIKCFKLQLVSQDTEVAHSEQNAGSSPQKRATNDPHLIRRILVSLSQWLEETFIYAQVAGPRNECTRIIEVNLLLCLKQNSGK